MQTNSKLMSIHPAPGGDSKPSGMGGGLPGSMNSGHSLTTSVGDPNVSMSGGGLPGSENSSDAINSSVTDPNVATARGGLPADNPSAGQDAGMSVAI